MKGVKMGFAKELAKLFAVSLTYSAAVALAVYGGLAAYTIVTEKMLEN